MADIKIDLKNRQGFMIRDKTFQVDGYTWESMHGELGTVYFYWDTSKQVLTFGPGEKSKSCIVEANGITLGGTAVPNMAFIPLPDRLIVLVQSPTLFRYHARFYKNYGIPNQSLAISWEAFTK